MATTFENDSTGARPPGALMRVLSTVMPGIGQVRSQTEPYAAAWRR